LWAAYGINRSENGKRTAPSAMNRQEIDLYVSIKSGVYLYDAQNNKLKAVADGDHRKDMGTQSFVGEASLVLVYVADFSRMSEKTTPERKQFYAGTDTGFISQNVYLYAASENLATVVLGSFNSDTIGKIIPLSKDQKITLTQAIGFPK